MDHPITLVTLVMRISSLCVSDVGDTAVSSELARAGGECVPAVATSGRAWRVPGDTEQTPGARPRAAPAGPAGNLRPNTRVEKIHSGAVVKVGTKHGETISITR